MSSALKHVCEDGLQEIFEKSAFYYCFYARSIIQMRLDFSEFLQVVIAMSRLGAYLKLEPGGISRQPLTAPYKAQKLFALLVAELLQRLPYPAHDALAVSGVELILDNTL